MTARLTAVAAVILAVAAFLPWAKVGINTGMSIPIDVANVTGIHTIWGIIVLIMAVLAISVAIINEFIQRFPTASAAIPGCIGIASIAGLIVRQQDLHSKHPQYGKLSSTEMHNMGMAFQISLSPGVYVALAAAVAVTILALVSLAFLIPQRAAHNADRLRTPGSVAQNHAGY